MSWAASCPGYRPEDHAPDLAPSDFSVSPPYESLHDEPKEQLEQAIVAAENLIQAGVVGESDGRHAFAINLNGHANPDHEPSSGYANDYVTVTIHQKSIT